MDPYGEEDAVKLMEEMTRFEAEIATNAALTGAGAPPRPIIGANTFDLVQKKLESVVGKPKSDLDPSTMTVPPPPPPSSGALPAAFPPIIPSMPAALAGIPPPPPPPPFMVPHNVRSSSRTVPPLTRLPPPPPPLLSTAVSYKAKPVITAKPPAKSVVVAAAPTKYDKSEAHNITNLDEELNNFLSEIRKEEEEMSKNKKLKTGAKLMAESVKASTTVSVQPAALTYEEMYGSGKKGKKNKKLVRMAGGQVWEDPSLMEWEDDDFRIFCGDLGNDVTDEVLTRAFNKYSSFLKAKVVRDKRTNKTKGFGFVSFKDPQDFIKAMKEMNGRYVGSRPIKLRKSTWKARSMETVKKKEKEKAVLINLLTGR